MFTSVEHASFAIIEEAVMYVMSTFVIVIFPCFDTGHFNLGYIGDAHWAYIKMASALSIVSQTVHPEGKVM